MASLCQHYGISQTYVKMQLIYHCKRESEIYITKRVSRNTGNDQKRLETTGNDMKEDGCLSVCVYSQINVSLLVLVTYANCVYKCV